MMIPNGSLVRSTAGHDKDKIYILIGRQEKVLLLADGKTKTLEHPKHKNSRHTECITDAGHSLTSVMETGEPIRNEMIRRAIRLHKKNLFE